MLPTSETESFVCCLSSLNAEKFDEWENSKLVEVMTAFLDTVITDFCETSKDIPFMVRAYNFAERHRPTGLGILGFHGYLQSHSIAFESMEAKLFNAKLFKLLKDRAYAESVRLGEELGYAPIFNEGPTTDIKRRNTTLLSVAPTSSSSFILGQTSQGIEPYRANFYIRANAKNKIPFKNPHLERLLEEKGKNTKEVWDIIARDFGSVKNLDFLSEHEKNVFKTFMEISQMEVIIQAAQRQKFIDQGQSLNIMVHPETPAKEVNKLMLEAHKLGIKSLYYQHNISAVQERNKNFSTCVSCES